MPGELVSLFRPMKTRIALLFAASLGALTPAFAAASAPEYQSMKIIQTTHLTFPYKARNLGMHEGQASVAIAVDENGRMTDCLVTSYSFPAFAEAAEAALKKWEFEPARVDGQARPATMNVRFNFENEGMVVVSLDVGTFVEQWNYRLNPGLYSFGACTMRELDRIPTPKKIVHPAYPASATPVNETVTVAVHFYIDTEGHVRMAAATRETLAAHEVLAAAAVRAVEQWEFEPPLSHGRPVLVAARQEFRFHPQKK